MEAKDTVMKEKDLWEGKAISVFAGTTEIAITPLYLFQLAKEYGLLKYQAEISFKAGIEQGLSDKIGVLNAEYRAGKKAGIREVVEWINNRPYEHWSASGKDKDAVIAVKFPLSVWQAKLKEWGIVK